MKIQCRPNQNLGPHREGEVLVKLRSDRNLGAVGNDSFAPSYGMELMEKVPLGNSKATLVGQPAEEFLRLRLPAGVTTEEALESLKDDPRVAYSAPNTIYQLDSLPNDFSDKLYGLSKIQAPEAWELTTGSRSGPIVAVLDTEVDRTHPDLKDNIYLPPGTNPAIEGAPVKEPHGTHCAGTIGAVGNNSQGVVGVNWQTRLLPVNIFGPWGADAVSITKALNYASSMGASIASCSFGGGVFNPIVYEAFKNSPMLHICASGNNANQIPHYPASFDLDNIVSVAATDQNDKLARYSNFGPDVDLAAPGSSILSTLPGGAYGELSGTSMAAPHVSGTAALIKTLYPEATGDQIKSRLLANTDPLPSLAGKVETGGRLNALKALVKDDIAPGAPGAFMAKPQGTRQVNLSWKSSGDDGGKGTASFYNLRYSENPISELAPAQSLGVATPKPSGSQENASLMLMPRAQARQIYCALQAVDKGGNSSTVSNTQCTVPAAKLSFDADGGSADAWKGEGTWAVTEVPGLGKVWSDSPQGEYANKLDMSLTSKPFSLKGQKDSTLYFEARYSIEREKDSLNIEASNDGGKNWSSLQVLSGDRPWGIQEVDLSKFDNQPNLQLRFRLKTDATGTRDGISLGKAVVGS